MTTAGGDVPAAADDVTGADDGAPLPAAATVGVVGAGVTGLALTHYLRERGVDGVTVEAAPEPGGVVRSERRDGAVFERGPQRIRLTDPVAGLVDDLGLRDGLLVAEDDLPLYVYADGRLRRVPRSLRAFLTTDLLSWRGKLRVLAEPLTAQGRPTESASALFARKFGQEAAENLLGPLFGGIYGSRPERMPAGYALEGLLRIEAREGSLLRPALRRARGGESAPAVTFEGGLQSLPEALYAVNRDRVHLDTPAQEVRETDEGFAVETPRGTVAVDRVVVTTPADASAALLADLSPESAAALADLHYNPLALVHLRADHGRRGLGYQVRAGEPLRTLGVSWSGPAFRRDDVHTAFLGGMRDPAVLDLSDEALGRLAREEFEAVLDRPATVANVARLDRGFPAYDDSWSALDALDLPSGVRLATNYTDRMGVPSRVRQARRLAGELASEVGGEA